MDTEGWKINYYLALNKANMYIHLDHRLEKQEPYLEFNLEPKQVFKL